MPYWSIDTAKVSVGDELYVAERSGWSSWEASKWEVVRKTPSGQLILSKGGLEIRTSASGRISNTYGKKQFVSLEEAVRLNVEREQKQAFQRISIIAEDLSKAARRENTDLMAETFSKLVHAIEARSATTPNPPQGRAQGDPV